MWNAPTFVRFHMWTYRFNQRFAPWIHLCNSNEQMFVHRTHSAISPWEINKFLVFRINIKFVRFVFFFIWNLIKKEYITFECLFPQKRRPNHSISIVGYFPLSFWKILNFFWQFLNLTIFAGVISIFLCSSFPFSPVS